MSEEPRREPDAEPRLPAAFVSAPPQRVLFLCIQNSARSQMAESLARRVAPDGTEIWSAGTRPTSIHPLARQVMSEVGHDLGPQRAKALDDVPWREADTIVTLCSEAEPECPATPGHVRRVHWPLPDPAAAPEAERLRAFRDAREELRWRVSCLWPSGN